MRNSYSSLFSFQNLGSPFPDQGFENLVRQIPQQRVSKITAVKLSEIVYFTFTDPAHKKYQIWIVNPQSNEIKHYNQILCFQQSTSPPIHVNMPSKKSKHAFFFLSKSVPYCLDLIIIMSDDDSDLIGQSLQDNPELLVLFPT